MWRLDAWNSVANVHNGEWFLMLEFLMRVERFLWKRINLHLVIDGISFQELVFSRHRHLAAMRFWSSAFSGWYGEKFRRRYMFLKPPALKTDFLYYLGPQWKNILTLHISYKLISWNCQQSVTHLCSQQRRSSTSASAWSGLMVCFQTDSRKKLLIDLLQSRWKVSSQSQNQNVGTEALPQPDYGMEEEVERDRHWVRRGSRS